MLATRFRAIVGQKPSRKQESPAAMVGREACPACGSHRYQTKGPPRHGKPKHPCHACPRQVTADALERMMAPAPRRRRAPLLGERLALRGLCRAVGGRLPWRFPLMGACWTACPAPLHAPRPAHPTDGLMARLAAEADARGRGVQTQASKQWLWRARDATTRQRMALHVGARRRTRGKARWANRPTVARAQATCPPDQ